MFAFPQGIHLSAKPLQPDFHSFVLTNIIGQPVYGVALTYYTPLGEDLERGIKV